LALRTVSLSTGHFASVQLIGQPEVMTVVAVQLAELAQRGETY
jgi:hypothetical protein